MTITSKFTEKEFISINFYILFNVLLPKVALLFIPVLFLSFLFSFLANPKVNFLSPLVFLSLLIAFLYYYRSTLKKQFNSKNRVVETISYTFEEHSLIITGESFNTQLSWNKLLKVKETKNWLLIFHNKVTVNAIPIKCFGIGQLKSLKVILDKNGLENNL